MRAILERTEHKKGRDAVCFPANLSRRGQQVDGGQEHPAATRLLALVHLQELDYGSTGFLWRNKHADTWARS